MVGVGAFVGSFLFIYVRWMFERGRVGVWRLGVRLNDFGMDGKGAKFLFLLWSLIGIDTLMD